MVMRYALLTAVLGGLAVPAWAADPTDTADLGRQHAIVNGRHVQPTPAEVQERLLLKRQAGQQQRAGRAANAGDSGRQ